MSIGASIGPIIGFDRSSSGAPQTTLTVAISDSADPVITAVNYDYTTVVTNTGANDATSVVCTITLDPQLTHVSTSGTGWTVDTSALPVITCTRATLAVGAAPTITTTVTSPSTAETSSTTADADASNSVAATQDTETTVCNLVSRDATSLKRVPATAQEWTDLIAYAGIGGGAAAPAFIWLCQEGSGNAAEVSTGPALVAGGSPLYAQAVAGWTRTALGTTDGTANQRFSSADAALPDISATPAMLLVYTAIAATPAGIRGVSCIGTTRVENRVNTTPVHRCVAVNTSDGTTTIGTGVLPVTIKADVGNSIADVYTDTDKVVPVFSGTITGKLLQLGATGAVAGPSRYLYAALFTGAAAQLSDANRKLLLQALGFTITWS